MSVVPSSSVASMVNLSRIYTRTGDEGLTRLAGGEQVPKTDVRVAACGAVDEANCAIGVALGSALDDDVAAMLRAVQNDLFDLGADLVTPYPDGPATGSRRIDSLYVDRLEAWCDRYGDDMPSLTSFVLPGGSQPAAQLHVARAVVRRAELAVWGAADVGFNPWIVRYLNRLSDLLFILARHCARQTGAEELLWVPGR